MPSRRHVFLSFKTEERSAAEELKKALAAAGYPVWWQDSIQCGKQWHADLDAALSEAGCVVVLWSNASVRSPWVRHEASQAIARNHYAPVRIDTTAIDTPYDHIQASNLVDWSGRPDHPGFVGLIRRIDELMPTRRALVSRFWQRHRWTMASVLFAAAAVALLVRLSITLDAQLNTQSAIAAEIQRTLQPLDALEVSAYMELTPAIEGVQLYVAELRRTLGRTENGTLEVSEKLPRDIYVSGRMNGRVKTLTIRRHSALWPRIAQFPALAPIVDFAGLKISFRRLTRGTDAKTGRQESEPWGDLTFEASAYFPEALESQGSEPALSWDVDTDILTLVFSASPPKRWWKSNGLVVSVPDVADSEIRVDVLATSYPSGGDRDLIDKNRSGLLLRTLFLSYSGRGMMLRAADMHQETDSRGLMTYSGSIKIVAKERAR